MAPLRPPTYQELLDELKAKIRQLESRPDHSHTVKHTLQSVIDMMEGDPNRFAKL